MARIALFDVMNTVPSKLKATPQGLENPAFVPTPFCAPADVPSAPPPASVVTVYGPSAPAPRAPSAAASSAARSAASARGILRWEGLGRRRARRARSLFSAARPQMMNRGFSLFRPVRLSHNRVTPLHPPGPPGENRPRRTLNFDAPRDAAGPRRGPIEAAGPPPRAGTRERRAAAAALTAGSGGRFQFPPPPAPSARAASARQRTISRTARHGYATSKPSPTARHASGKYILGDESLPAASSATDSSSPPFPGRYTGQQSVWPLR